MIACIPTKGRPNTKTYKLFQEVGIEICHFIEPQEINKYDVPHKINIGKNDGGISYVRNFILQWAKKNSHEWIIMCDDDINSFYIYKNKKNIKIDASFWYQKLKKAKNLPFEMHGINNKQFIWTATNNYAINRYSVEACILMNTKKIKWKYKENTKEDKDFALQTIKYGNGIVKYLNIGFNTPKVGSNSGGLHEQYAIKTDHKWAKKMVKDWHPFAKLINKKTTIDVKIDFKNFTKSHNKTLV